MSDLTKQFRLKEATPEGAVAADVATLNVVDHDGDVTKQGFFGKQTVAIVSGHDWGDILLGKGVISDADGKKARFDGQLNLDDPDAAKLHSKLKFDMADGDPIVEWSYGFRVHEGGAKMGEFNGQQVQFLQPLADGSPGAEIMEVSPVVKGAGIGTGTTNVKSRKFADHIESVLHTVNDAVGRAEAVAALRAEDGKTISADAQRQLADLRDEMAVLTAKIAKILEPEPKPEDTDVLTTQDLERLQAQYDYIRSGLGELTNV